MSSRVKRVFGAVATVAALTATLGLTAEPAGAGVTATNDKFCAVVSGDQGLGIDFSGLGRDEAKYATGLSRKAAKTGVPAKLTTDLTKLAKVYDRVAGGASSKKVVADEQTFIVSALTRFGKYVAANCIATAPSTPSTASASAQSSASAQATAGTWNGIWKSDKYPLNSTFRMTLTIAAGSLTPVTSPSTAPTASPPGR